MKRRCLSFFIKLIAPVIISATVYSEDLADKPVFQSRENVTFSEGIKILVNKNGKVLQSKAMLFNFEALKEEAYGSQYPDISFLAFVAPMFKVTGDALATNSDYSKWGPLLYGQTTVSLPIFTFGRISNAKKAADFGIVAGSNLHKGRVNDVIFEYKKLYLSLILLKRFRTVLADGQKRIKGALTKAEEIYQSGQGKMKKKDLVRLKLFSLELKKWQVEFEAKKRVATLAMGHFLGKEFHVDAVDDDFPEIEEESRALKALVDLGFKEKPEWKALQAGIRARQYQLEMEEAGNLPVFFIGARAQATYTSVADRQQSVFANDRFNTVAPAVVLGAKWDLNWGKTKAKVTKAKGELASLHGKKVEAISGIPFTISQAYWELEKSRKHWRISQKRYKEATKWSFAEWSAYSAGVGEAKDLLEALAAFFTIQKEMAEAEYNYLLAWANLSLQVGKQSMLTRWKTKKEEDE